jgi:hypothetical protein
LAAVIDAWNRLPAALRAGIVAMVNAASFYAAHQDCPLLGRPRSLLETLKNRAEIELRRGVSRLPAEEAAVLALLQQRMKHAITQEEGRHRTGRDR